MDSVQLAGVALAALLSENFILVNCLGIGTRVEAFHSTTAARRTGLSLTLAMVVTVFFTWCADFLVLRHFGWVYLRTLVFSLIALLTVFLLRKAARLWPELSHRIDADLASVSTNCAVLGAAYLAAQRSYTLSQALSFALCGGLGVLVDRDQSVLKAGGYLIQLLPGAGEDIITKVEGSVLAAGAVTKLLQEDDDPESMLRRALSDFDLEILERSPIEYRCYCSRDRMERALISLGPTELRSLLDEQGEAELTCRFCDNVQHFSRQDLEGLLEGMQKKF